MSQYSPHDLTTMIQALHTCRSMVQLGELFEFDVAISLGELETLAKRKGYHAFIAPVDWQESNRILMGIYEDTHEFRGHWGVWARFANGGMLFAFENELDAVYVRLRV